MINEEPETVHQLDSPHKERWFLSFLPVYKDCCKQTHDYSNNYTITNWRVSLSKICHEWHIFDNEARHEWHIFDNEARHEWHIFDNEARQLVIVFII